MFVYHSSPWQTFLATAKSPIVSMCSAEDSDHSRKGMDAAEALQTSQRLRVRLGAISASQPGSGYHSNH